MRWPSPSTVLRSCRLPRRRLHRSTCLARPRLHDRINHLFQLARYLVQEIQIVNVRRRLLGLRVRSHVLRNFTLECIPLQAPGPARLATRTRLLPHTSVAVVAPATITNRPVHPHVRPRPRLRPWRLILEKLLEAFRRRRMWRKGKRGQDRAVWCDQLSRPPPEMSAQNVSLRSRPPAVCFVFAVRSRRRSTLCPRSRSLDADQGMACPAKT